MLDLKTRMDIQRLVDEGLEESLTLDYKASPALSRSGDGPVELCKDVSALANSAGGQLVYGIEENKKTKKPARVDDGVADEKITREWIEKILNSRVQPRMVGVQIGRIDMENGKFGYVINVPQSQIGPHQAPDQKYYRRYDLQSVPMHDYEIRDIMRRATTPELQVLLALGDGRLQFNERGDHSRSFPIFCTIKNLSGQPAYHVTLDIFIEADIGFFFSNEFSHLGGVDREGPMRLMRRIINSPPSTPIFREDDDQVHRGEIGLTWPRSATRGEPIRRIETFVRTPGYTRSETWLLHLRGNELSLHAPDSDYV